MERSYIEIVYGSYTVETHDLLALGIIADDGIEGERDRLTEIRRQRSHTDAHQKKVNAIWVKGVRLRG